MTPEKRFLRIVMVGVLPMRVNCPNCHQDIRLEEEHIGMVVACPLCSNEFKTKKETAWNKAVTKIKASRALSKENKAHLCQSCLSKVIPMSSLKGTWATELVLWIAMLIPGMIYTAWRHSGGKNVCPSCGERGELIPWKSPKAKKIIERDNLSDQETVKGSSFRFIHLIFVVFFAVIIFLILFAFDFWSSYYDAIF